MKMHGKYFLSKNGNFGKLPTLCKIVILENFQKDDLSGQYKPPGKMVDLTAFWGLKWIFFD